jgi:hypothetical protein
MVSDVLESSLRIFRVKPPDSAVEVLYVPLTPLAQPHHHTPDEWNPHEMSVRGVQTGGHTLMLQNTRISMNKEIGIRANRSYFISKRKLNYVCCRDFGDALEFETRTSDMRFK